MRICALFSRQRAAIALILFAVGLFCVISLASCAKNENAAADVATKPNSLSMAGTQAVTVGITKISRRPLERQLTVSSELVPFQEIDVYAKEAGYVKQLLVDYGSHVSKGQ